MTSPRSGLASVPPGGFITRVFVNEAAPNPDSSFANFSVALRGAQMEGLIDLVAASFVRHGIECPTGDSEAARRTRPAEPTPPDTLPEHSYRKKEGDLAT